MWGLDHENVVANYLINQVFAQFWRDLQRIHSQGKQDFDDTFRVALLLCCQQLLLVLEHNRLAEEFRSIAAPLAAENLVVFGQLDLVVVDGLAQIIRNRVSIFNVVKLLQTVDRDRKNLSCRLEHRRVLSAELGQLAGRVLLLCNFVLNELGVELGHSSQVRLRSGHLVYLKLLLEFLARRIFLNFFVCFLVKQSEAFLIPLLFQVLSNQGVDLHEVKLLHHLN